MSILGDELLTHKLFMQQQAAAVDWWHSGIDLGDGVVTVGRSHPAVNLLPYLRLPNDMTGLTVLDICAWDGFMSFECERRGARVVAVDSCAWDKSYKGAAWHRTGRDGFDLAHNALHSRVQPVHCEVLDLDVNKLGTFDIVLFLGVLYHMRHPLLALERVAALVGGTLIVETHADLHDVKTPAMRFYPGAEVNNDASNWWGPNPACVEAMLHDVGFATVKPIQTGARTIMHASGRAA